MGTGMHPPSPPSHTHPGYTPAMPASALPYPYSAAAGLERCRGALIGSPTLFIPVILRVKDYDRGITPTENR